VTITSSAGGCDTPWYGFCCELDWLVCCADKAPVVATNRAKRGIDRFIRPFIGGVLLMRKLRLRSTWFIGGDYLASVDPARAGEFRKRENFILL
jgi:hypothetical protein